MLKESAQVLKVEEVDVIPSSTIKLSCIAKGQPTPKISWSYGHNNVVATTENVDLEKSFTTLYLDAKGNEIENHLDSVDPFYSQVKKLDDNSLQLDVIFKDRTAFAPNIFRCDAINAHDSDDESIKVELREYIKFADEDGTEAHYPADLSEELDLECNIEGDPRPTIRWVFVS